MKHTIAVIVGYLFAAAMVLAAEPEVVEIRLASEPAKALYAGRNKPVEFTAARASKFRMQRGLADGKLTSFELVGAKNHYLRHRGFVLRLDENVKLNPLYNADTSFKVVQVGDNKVRLEASNYPNKFLAMEPAGGVVLISNATPEMSTFVLKKEGSVGLGR